MTKLQKAIQILMGKARQQRLTLEEDAVLTLISEHIGDEKEGNKKRSLKYYAFDLDVNAADYQECEHFTGLELFMNDRLEKGDDIDCWLVIEGRQLQVNTRPATVDIELPED